MTDTTMPKGETIRIEYVPRPGLGGITIVNFLLGLVTLTIYRFWAKTNVRRHIWSCVHINGQPLEYTGRGIELFKGALFVFAVLILPMILVISFLAIAYGPEHPAIGAIQALLFLVIAVLWGAALYRARRYQLSRTLWRGIRGSLEGSTVTYTLLYFGSFLARAMSLGWSTPVLNYSLQEQMIGSMRFGSMPFRFKGRAGPLYPSYALCWVLTLVAFVLVIIVVAAGIGTLFSDDLKRIFGEMAGGQNAPAPEQNIAIIFGSLFVLYLIFFTIYPIIWSLYTAREMAIFANYTTAEAARFKMDVSARSVIWLTIGNFLIWIFTLGIGAPFVKQRTIKFLCDRVSVDGTIDVDAILQSKAPLGTMGEGLADAFDVGGL